MPPGRRDDPGPTGDRTWTAWPERVDQVPRSERASGVPRSRKGLPGRKPLGARDSAASGTGQVGRPVRRDFAPDLLDRPAADPYAEPESPGRRRSERDRASRSGASRLRGAERPGRPDKPGGRPRRRLSRPSRKVGLIGGLVLAAALALAAFIVLRPPPAHVITLPTTLGSYVKQSAGDATAAHFRYQVVAGASGEVRKVVAAVYERKTGPGTGAGPQVIIFIGGNLAGGASQSGLISAFLARLHGSFTTSPGQLGGQAACAPGSNGAPAECAWVDGDTFGVVVSATLNASGLAAEMRTMRPLVEHVAG